MAHDPQAVRTVLAETLQKEHQGIDLPHGLELTALGSPFLQ